MSAVTLNSLQLDVITALIRGDSIIPVRAGWGSGKTSTLVFALMVLSKTRPGTSSLLITDTADRYRSVLAPEIAKWCVDRLSPAYRWRYHERNGCWTDPQTNSKIYVRAYYRPKTRSSTHNPLEGINATSGVALVDECQTLTKEVADKAIGRIRSGPKPQLVLVGLPVLGAWWEEMGTRSGHKPIHYASHVNKANLADAWFDVTKANLSKADYEAMVLNKPKPVSGMVYSDFRAEEWPEGNLAPASWRYKPTMRGRIAIDPGLRQPAVLLIVEDDEIGADVIVGEITPKEMSLPQLTATILAQAWPRNSAALMPDDGRERFLLDRGAIDKAARQRSDRTLTSTVQDLGRPVGSGGIGLHMHTTTLGPRTKISNGVKQVQKRICHDGKRRLLIHPEVWARGMSDGHTLRKAIGAYKYPEGQTGADPIKDGREHLLDALRYDTVAWHWVDVPTPQAMAIQPKRTAPVSSHKRWRDRRGGTGRHSDR